MEQLGCPECGEEMLFESFRYRCMDHPYIQTEIRWIECSNWECRHRITLPTSDYQVEGPYIPADRPAQ